MESDSLSKRWTHARSQSEGLGMADLRLRELKKLILLS